VSSPTQRESFLSWVAPIAVLVLAGCSSDSDSVCTDIGDCAQGGASSWVESCQSEADLLQQQANEGGCGSRFGAYYSCASSNYTCNGATPSFPGCDAQRTALDGCLAAITAGSYCAQLVAAEAACASPGADSGPSGGGGRSGDAAGSGGGATEDAGSVPPACTLARDCQAQCYLANVGNACAPAVNELQASNTCAAACPL